MFRDAVGRASGFTRPFVGLRYRENGTVTATMATFVVLDDDGWIATAAHVVHNTISVEAQILGKQAAPEGQRVLANSEIWAVGVPKDGVQPRLAFARLNRWADIAIGKLEPFDPAWVESMPVLRDTAAEPLEQGESMCLLGFPFHEVAATFEPELGFTIAPGGFPVPRFSIDGIIARFHEMNRDDSSATRFVELSCPALRGQSGGPMVDREGRVCGLISRTAHLDLGFDATYTDVTGSQVVERQFLNVGVASHVDELRAMLKRREDHPR
jgi:S1-C subfamily serine protease